MTQDASPAASSTSRVDWSSYLWAIVTIVYSAWELFRPHSQTMFVLWVLSLASGVVWLAFIPFLAKLRAAPQPATQPVD